jgi:hypothetical protein
MSKILIVALATILLAGCEQAQREIYDRKADVVGTKRVATIYAPYTGQVLRTIEDDSMTFSRSETGGISIWLGTKNRKVWVSNTALLVIEDKP